MYKLSSLVPAPAARRPQALYVIVILPDELQLQFD
jgi:hypothetical protein